MDDRPKEIHTCHVCVNLSCAEGGSEAIRSLLAEKLEGSGIEVKTQICFGACWMGPNIVLHPEGTWYSNVQAQDVDEIVAHITGGEPVERLVNRSDEQLHELVISILDSGL
jgi:(2Fe-2S) ferredoxin